LSGAAEHRAAPPRLPGTPAEARAVSQSLGSSLRDGDPGLVTLDGIDLGPALEQQLFFALRDGAPPAGGTTARMREASLGVGRALAATGASLLRRRSTEIPPGPIVVLVRLSARFGILAPVEAELMRLGGDRLVVLRVGRAAEVMTSHPRSPRLQDELAPSIGLRGLRSVLGIERRIDNATRGWDEVIDREQADRLRAIARRELPRISLGAAAIESIGRRWRPRLLVSFDEVGTWSRILPAVARQQGVPTLNLPHAVATLSAATAGADYDRFAVFGSRSAAVLVAAGIPEHRIVVTGAPYFDALARQPVLETLSERRIVFAAQYIQGSITASRFEGSYLGALAAAEAVAPSELVVLPHPVQPSGLIERLLARHAPPAGVRQRLAKAGTLHAELPGAFVLVSGPSNTVFEASLAGVPSILVDPRDTDPGTFAADGLAIGVADGAAAGSAARSLRDSGFRAAVLQRAREASVPYLGPPDGRAAERTAELILELAGPLQPDGKRG
jgi:hypothetical protein